jgi:hypothetical protein
MSETWLHRAERYRDRAEEIRIMADSVNEKDAKESLRQVAMKYDKMAESCLKYAVNDVSRS